MAAVFPRARRSTHLLVSLSVVCALVASASASAGEMPSSKARSVKRTGSCSGPTDWTLVVRPGDTGKLVVVFSARGGPSGKVWTIFISDTASKVTYSVYAGNRTSGADGNFRVRVVTKNRQGTDHIAAGANSTTGETCSGHASY